MCKCVSYANDAFILRKCMSLLCRRKKRTPKRWRIFVRASHTCKTSCTGLSTTANHLHCFFWYTKLEAVSSTCRKGNADEGKHGSSHPSCQACILHRQIIAQIHAHSGKVLTSVATGNSEHACTSSTARCQRLWQDLETNPVNRK